MSWPGKSAGGSAPRAAPLLRVFAQMPEHSTR